VAQCSELRHDLLLAANGSAPQLPPHLIEAIALGRLEVGVSRLLRGKLSASWLAQREALVAGSC